MGSPPQVAKNGPFSQGPIQRIYQRRGRVDFQIFGLVGLHFLAFLALWAFISLHFGLMGLHFLAFWPCGPSFPCILALWAFISLHFGLVGLYFLAFWPCGPSFPCILALWAFISLHFGLVGVHFLVFWPCGPSFPFILAFSGSASRVPPKSCEKWPVCPTSLQWIYQRRDRLHFEVFSFLGLHFCPFWPCGPSFPCILALWAFISLYFGLVGLHFLAFRPCGPSFPCILALWAFISLHFGLVGLHFLSFWPCGPSFPCILALWAFISLHFGLACRPCGPSFPCILALWAFISLHFGLVGLHFLAFSPCGLSFPCILAFSGSASGVPPISCQKLPVCPTSLQWIYQRRDRRHFAVFNLLGLHFLVFWPCGPSFPFILAFSGSASRAPPTSCEIWPVCPTSLQWIYQRRDRLHFEVFSFLGLHFCPFWPCGPSFPCILALWAFISLHFGIVGLHFLAFWPCGPSFPCILALWAFISLHFGLACRPCGPSFPCILALWAFISLHFGLVGLHFLAFWPCGLSFPCILAFSGSASGVPPISCQKWPVCPTSLQWIYQRRDRRHFAVFNLLGLHFLVFWPCGPSFPFILAFSGSASRAPPTSCEIWPVCPTSLQWIYQRRDRLHFEVFSFLSILALWAFISLHFGLVGLHFLAFWHCGPSFPCILALWAFISFHFGLVGLHFLAFWPCGLSFPCILALWAFISLHFGLVGLHFLAFWPCGPSFPCISAPFCSF